jgi:hypothetical protein
MMCVHHKVQIEIPVIEMGKYADDHKCLYALWLWKHYLLKHDGDDAAVLEVVPWKYCFTCLAQDFTKQDHA